MHAYYIKDFCVYKITLALTVPILYSPITECNLDQTECTQVYSNCLEQHTQGEYSVIVDLLQMHVTINLNC